MGSWGSSGPPTAPQMTDVNPNRWGGTYEPPMRGWKNQPFRAGWRSDRYLDFRMQGLFHSGEPEKSMRVELWVGIAQSGWMQMIWRGIEGPAQCDEAMGRRLDQKVSSPVKPESHT